MNKLKKHSVTKNCSELSLFEQIVLVISKVFQKVFSITKTIFSHSMSEQFWKENTISLIPIPSGISRKNFRDKSVCTKGHTGFGPGGNMYDNNFQKEGGFSAISPICMTKALHTKTVNARWLPDLNANTMWPIPLWSCMEIVWDLLSVSFKYRGSFAYVVFWDFGKKPCKQKTM